ncbi:MAG: Lpg1974 family pore-forming outer membrane protein [Chlamydiae bacterium]|nr:Lpg1974 family pore-forming outer membrane protein [Chlamydiota bacterium]
MLKPLKCLLFTQVALSAALSAYEEDDLLDDLFLDETIADVSEYPCIAERSQPEPGVPSLERRHHYFLMGEMLYLKPSLDSMPWLSVYDNTDFNDPDLVSTTFSSQSDKLKLINIPFDFGFRVAAGFNASWLNLEILGSWERFHTSNTTSVPKLTVIKSDSGYNQPVMYDNYWSTSLKETPDGQVYFANNQTQFHWDQIDLTAKIPLKALNCFTLSPVLGVRGLISNFDTTTSLFYNQYGSTYTTTPPYNENIDVIKQKYNAIGLLGGLDGDVNFGKGFHLSALLEGALVFGELKTYNNSQLILPGPTLQSDSTTKYPTISNLSMKSYGFKPMLDAQVALSWNRAFWKDKITLNIHLGYEAHFMPNFFELQYYITDTKHNAQPTYFDLTMQGLDAGIGLSF